MLLSRTQLGAVTACGCHPVVHIEFGNWQLDMSCQAFPDLVEMIVQLDASELGVVGSPDQTLRPFYMPVNNSPLVMRFSLAEFTEFQALLNATRPYLYLLKAGHIANMRN